MTDDLKPDAPHGDYEHQDLTPSGILYFLLALGIATILSLLFLRALYGYLDRREKATQPEVNPLVTNIPQDTRHVPPGYPQTAFPSPKLEEDERSQLNDIRMDEEKTLYTYGWVDEKAGTVHIPIERAMDLIVQRGLPVRQQSAPAPGTESGRKESTNQSANKGKKK